MISTCPFIRYFLKVNEPTLMPIGTSSPWGKGMKRSTAGVRRSSFSTTLGRVAFLVTFSPFLTPVTSTWPHLRRDVGLEEGEYRENCLCLAVLCTIIMVHKDTSSSYRSVNCIGL